MKPPSSSGLGYRPLTAKTGVRVPVGVSKCEARAAGRGLARLVAAPERSLSSAGRAPRSHRGGRRFKSCSDHAMTLALRASYEVRVITSLSLAFHTAPARWCSGTVARCLSHLRGCRALSGLRSGSIDQASVCRWGITPSMGGCTYGSDFFGATLFISEVDLRTALGGG